MTLTPAQEQALRKLVVSYKGLVQIAHITAAVPAGVAWAPQAYAGLRDAEEDVLRQLGAFLITVDLFPTPPQHSEN